MAVLAVTLAVGPFRAAVLDNLAVRYALDAAVAVSESTASRVLTAWSDGNLQQTLSSNESWGSIQVLRSLGDDPVRARRARALYVDRSNRIWGLADSEYAILSVPALARTSVVSGLPDRETVQRGWYGFADYEPRPDSYGSSLEGYRDVEEDAARMGFRELGVLTPDGEIQFRTLGALP